MTRVRHGLASWGGSVVLLLLLLRFHLILVLLFCSVQNCALAFTATTRRIQPKTRVTSPGTVDIPGISTIVLHPREYSSSLYSESTVNNNKNRVLGSLGSSDPLSSDSGVGVSGSSSSLRKKQDLRQFSRYLEVECWKRAELRSLEPVLLAVANACKQINRIVQRAQTDDIYGVATTTAATTDATASTITNVQGEVQQKLDVLCNDYLLRAFCGSSRFIHSVASEEEDEPRCCSDVMVRVCVWTTLEFTDYKLHNCLYDCCVSVALCFSCVSE